MSGAARAPNGTEAAARMMIVGGVAGAVILPFVSWPAAIMCGLVAWSGFVIERRGRPTSRWAYGWTAFRQRSPRK